MQLKNASIIACHECDLLHHQVDVPVGGAARCSRCGSALYRPKRDSLNRTFALTVAGIIFFLIANIYPFLGFRIGAQIRQTTLATGIYELYLQQMSIIATLVLLTVIVVPAANLLCMCYILIPLRAGRVPWHLAKVFRLYLFLKPWGMVEIFMLGILVSAIKLVKMATIIPGVALYSFMALMFILAAMTVTLDRHLIWEQIKWQ
ncbi:MAG: paraquat-inducible protein A [Desulfofustis sp.]|nr:paraquat-inducible protein A [Desulfofustis sp.]